MILSLQFTVFDIQAEYEFDDAEYEHDYDSLIGCFDHLTITEGNGTTLMEKSCGHSHSSSLPPPIKSTSNIVKLMFSTDNEGTRTGWSVTWNAMAPGEC